jgi:biopolymer transport protein ExbD
MRRFSQRSHLVTLSEINITPLLDLAFVLLIIFVITTPLLEQGLSLQLPAGGRPDQPFDRKDIQTVEVSAQGVYLLNGTRMPLEHIEAALVRIYQANPRMIVYIRADEDGAYKLVAGILNRCERNGITRVSLRTDAMHGTR